MRPPIGIINEVECIFAPTGFQSYTAVSVPERTKFAQVKWCWFKTLGRNVVLTAKPL